MEAPVGDYGIPVYTDGCIVSNTTSLLKLFLIISTALGGCGRAVNTIMILIAP